MIRVLLVDDSPTARHLLYAVLSGAPDIEVIAQAKDGAEAVEMTAKLRPDVVVMDVEMPKMNGFEASREIMVHSPTPIVNVSASTKIDEVTSAMQALAAGALTLVAKPPGPESPKFARAAQDLIEMVKAMAEVKVVRRRQVEPELVAKPPLREASKQSTVASTKRIRAVGIAASTGGPPALRQVLCGLGDNFSVPILVVQHIAAGFTEGLAVWLDSATSFNVKIAKQGEPLLAGHVYLAPEERHLGATMDGAVAISNDPPIDGFSPSASFLFQSLAKVYGASLAAVILTGMGNDGVQGLLNVSQTGGRIFAQDEESSVVFGMPGAAVQAGVVDYISSLGGISAELRRLVDGR